MKRILCSVIILMSLLPVYAFYHIDGVINNVSAYSITVVGNYAFLNINWQLNIVDISDPFNPHLLNIVNNLYQGDAVIKDTLAYISDYQSIKVVNISNPLQPVLVGQTDSLAQISNFAVSEPYVYICSRDSTMQIIDISDLSNPQSVGSCHLQRLSRIIFITGNLMFVSGGGDSESSIQIIDVSNPINPAISYTCDTFYTATGIAVDGNIAYIANRYDGMLIWDISNPCEPVDLGTFDPGRAVFDVSIQGNIACLANELNGILLVNISDPQSPQIIGTCDTPDFANQIVYRGNYVYVVTYDGFLTVDVSDPLPMPNVVGSYYVQDDEYTSLAFVNNYIYVTDLWDGIKILDVSNPFLPMLQTELSDFGASDIQIMNNKAFVLSRMGSYDIVDVTNPDNPQALGSYTGLSYPMTAIAAGNSAYILDGDLGLVILDITNATSPTLQGTYADLVYPYAIAIRGNYAYILDHIASFPKVKIINISNHYSPQYAGECNIPHDPNAIAIYGNYAYIVSSEGGLQIYQINNSTSMSLLSSILPHPTSDLLYCFVDGSRLYVSDQNWNEIDIFDLSNPSQPSLINSYKCNYATADMKINNNLLYTANQYSGMHIMDLNIIVGNDDPEYPVLPDKIALSAYPNPVYLNGSKGAYTFIEFTLPEKAKTKPVIEIYNLKGQKVRTMTPGESVNSLARKAGVNNYELRMPNDELECGTGKGEATSPLPQNRNGFTNASSTAASAESAFGSPNDRDGRLTNKQDAYATESYSTVWDCLYDRSQKLATGIYIVKVSSGR